MPRDDPDPHSFRLAVTTWDASGKKSDQDALIGFDVRRLPVLKNEKEIVGAWRRGGPFSRGPVEQDPGIEAWSAHETHTGNVGGVSLC